MMTGEEMSGRWDRAKLDELLDGMSRMEFMVRFAIAQPALDTTIIGTKNVNHLRDNIVAALKGPLPVSVVEEAKRRLDAAGSRPV
jgi:aryl-alcohol dehydrogenase-like predicted oxidoreductase